MIHARLTAVAFSVALLVGAPALAQDAMSSGAMKPEMKMTKSQMAMMTKCQKMTHDMMMKNKSCAKMMKMHPDMMKSGM